MGTRSSHFRFSCCENIESKQEYQQVCLLMVVEDQIKSIHFSSKFTNELVYYVFFVAQQSFYKNHYINQLEFKMEHNFDHNFQDVLSKHAENIKFLSNQISKIDSSLRIIIDKIEHLETSVNKERKKFASSSPKVLNKTYCKSYQILFRAYFYTLNLKCKLICF